MFAQFQTNCVLHSVQAIYHNRSLSLTKKNRDFFFFCCYFYSAWPSFQGQRNILHHHQKEKHIKFHLSIVIQSVVSVLWIKIKLLNNHHHYWGSDVPKIAFPDHFGGGTSFLILIKICKKCQKNKIFGWCSSWSHPTPLPRPCTKVNCATGIREVFVLTFVQLIRKKLRWQINGLIFFSR